MKKLFFIITILATFTSATSAQDKMYADDITLSKNPTLLNARPYQDFYLVTCPVGYTAEGTMYRPHDSFVAYTTDEDGRVTPVDIDLDGQAISLYLQNYFVDNMRGKGEWVTEADGGKSFKYFKPIKISPRVEKRCDEFGEVYYRFYVWIGR